MDLDDEFAQRVCDLMFEISQAQFSLDDDAIEAEPDAGRRAVYTGLLMLNDDLRYQNEQRAIAQGETVEREARLRAIFELSRIAIWDCNLEALRRELHRHASGTNGKPLEEYPEAVRALTSRLTIRTVNQEALQMMRVDDAAALHGHLSGLALNDGARVLGTLWRGLAEGKKRVEVEGTLRAANGERLTVLAGLSVPEGTERGEDLAIITIADITAHHARVLAEREVAQRTEELARVNAEVERLFYAVAHDLRSPLRAVDTLASWIIDDFDAGEVGEVREHVKTLRQRIERLDRMLNDLLSYARIGRTQLPVELVDVGALLTEVTTTLVQIPAGFTVTWSELPRLTTYRTLLSQVFQNLISNALKHHDRDEGRIEISAEDARDRWIFRVIDDGPGIPESHRQRIFGLFATLKRRDEVEGSGMGLAFVQKVVRRIGGQIVAEGPEGRGITFKFEWPKFTPIETGPAADHRSGDPS